MRDNFSMIPSKIFSSSVSEVVIATSSTRTLQNTDSTRQQGKNNKQRIARITGITTTLATAIKILATSFWKQRQTKHHTLEWKKKKQKTKNKTKNKCRHLQTTTQNTHKEQTRYISTTKITTLRYQNTHVNGQLLLPWSSWLTNFGDSTDDEEAKSAQSSQTLKRKRRSSDVPFSSLGW